MHSRRNGCVELARKYQELGRLRQQRTGRQPAKQPLVGRIDSVPTAQFDEEPLRASLQPPPPAHCERRDDSQHRNDRQHHVGNHLPGLEVLAPGPLRNRRNSRHGLHLQ